MKIDYETIIKRSFEITKKYKWLLIYGLLIGSGSSINFNNIFNYSFDGSEFDQNEIQEFPTKTAQVLGAKTSAFMEWIGTVSPLTWIILGLIIVALIVVGILITLILKNWAKASLIKGVQMALNDEEEVNIRNTSPTGLRYFKNLIILSLINIGFTLLFVVVVPAIGIIVYYLVRNITILKVLWIVIASISGTIIFLLGIIIIAMIGVYAERLIVLHDSPPYEAWKKGLNLSKKNFLRTLLMGILNMILATMIGCVGVLIPLIILGIPSFVLLYPSISNRSFPHPLVFVILGIFLLAFILFNTLIKAGIAVFRYSNWNQLFNIVIAHTQEAENNGTE